VQKSEDAKESDFETIIFPTKNTSGEFKSFLKGEKKETPKKDWKRSNKFR